MPRKLPRLTPESEPFWTGGGAGELRIRFCTTCERYFHPPGPVCPVCAGADVPARAVSGRGRVFSYTINHRAWTPELTEPYVIALVELAEQAGLRFLTNVVNCPVDDVRIGMPVRVVFQQHEDIWLPVFEPAA